MDPDNSPGPLSFAWRMTAKPASSARTDADIVGALTAMASFTPDVRGDFTFELTVSDGELSATDFVVIHVHNNPPVAHAGPDRNVQTATVATLDGSQSFDPDGDLITYDWRIEWSLTAKPATSTLTDTDIVGRTTPKPTFTPDVDGAYVFRLVVNDGQDDSPPAFVMLTASTPNVLPNANAGADQTAIEGALVLLDGRASHDPDNVPQPLTFRWAFVSVPAGSALQDSDIFTADRVQASFVPDAPGVYGLNLHVKAYMVIGLVGTLLASLGSLGHATVMNGDFSAGFTGWTTEDMDTNGTLTSPSASATETGGEAVLATQGLPSGIVQISLLQALHLPARATTLSFDIGFISGMLPDSPPGGSAFPDFVEASYLNDADASFDRAFVGLDVNGAYNPSTLAPVALLDLGNGLFRFTTAITALAGRTGTLFFDLSDRDDGAFSSARVDNVTITVRTTAVPEPATWLLCVSGLLGLLGLVRQCRQ